MGDYFPICEAVKDVSRLYLPVVRKARSKLITACACINKHYIKGSCISCDYVVLVPRKLADCKVH